MLETEIPTEFKDYHIIIGGDFNSVTEARSKEMLGFLGMNVDTVNTNNALKHSAPTCSSNDMTQYTSVDDHVYSNDLKVVEYSVHPEHSVKKYTNSKFLFSDHLPVYATIDMPS
jgi:endonuclease/exonuclease/phosphatase family metal-dependent hydrolase